MNALPSGEVRGLTWYEIPREATGWSGRNLPPEIQTITVLAPLGMTPRQHILDMLAKNPAAVSIAAKIIPFRPFDTAVELPGREVWWAYHDFTDEAITAWAHANLDIPTEIDLVFRSNHGNGTVSAVARTMRNGRPIEVRRKLSPDKTMTEALAEHIPYFLRNCPRMVDTDGRTCGTHVAEILSSVTRRGVGIAMEEWLATDPSAPDAGGKLIVSGDFLPGTGVASLTLDRDRNTGAVRATVRTVDGHGVQEDDKGGVDVLVRGAVPATVAASLPGRSLSDVIEPSWARHLVIRKFKPGKRGEPTFGLRCGVAHVPMPRISPAPSSAVVDDQFAAERLRWETISSAALEPLRHLDRADLADVLTILHMRGEVDLERWNLAGWRLKAMGNMIDIADCPLVPAAELLGTKTDQDGV